MLKRIWELCRKKLALYYVSIALLSVSGVFALPLLFSGIEKNNLGLVIAVIVAEVLIVTFSRAVNA